MSDAADETIRDLVHLTLISGVGPRTCRALLDHFGSAGGVLKATTAALKSVDGVGPKMAQKIVESRQTIDVGQELAICRQRDVTLLPSDDPAYPELLTQIPDPPPLLYLRGRFAPADALAIGIVGSRHATPYGIRMAERLAASLARVGITVISGLARGIDAAAHRGALKAGGRTIAVLANGLDSIYPPEHEALAEEIADGRGAIVSEMPMRQEPIAQLFPQRNRIVSGLSLGVVVVEAAPRSGSLSTARHALEQNREVFAVPGPADSLASRGCHQLIRDGARLVETVEDILEELGPLAREVQQDEDTTPVRHPAELSLNDQERAVLGFLGDAPRSVDELIVRSGLTASQVMATLAILEVRRLVRRGPGGQFARPS